MAEPDDLEAVAAFQNMLAKVTNHRFGCSYIKHFLSDEQATDVYEKTLADYAEQWPGYCEECSGWGGRVSYYDPSPVGVGLSAGGFPDYDPCQSCTAQGKCPRCGQESETAHDPDWEEFVCPECSWTEGRSEGIPLDGPFPTECNCWEYELDEFNEGGYDG